MRKKMLVLCGLISFGAQAQDSLKTTLLQEVVVTGTKFEVPVEKSGKTIHTISQRDLEQSGGVPVSELLNQVPGVQMDGNFGTPGSNLSYYLRGARNRQTLILIDGVPLNDPSAINAEYDLRYIPVSQIESIEVLKGGLSTLYGTSAAAGVISIKLKEPTQKFSGAAELTAGSFKTFSQNVNVGGTQGELSYFVALNNLSSEGFSSAQDNDNAVEFDKDGFTRRNGLVKLGYNVSKNFSVKLHSAYETFEADYDAYEFTDAKNSQAYDQLRLGLVPTYTYGKGQVEGKFFYNINERKFFSAFPSEYTGNNFQGEITHRHHITQNLQSLIGLNYQDLAFEQKGSISNDTANFVLFDPYASLLLDLANGLSIHAGLRLNTHSVYGSKLVYNVNPSMLFNADGKVMYKVFASVATSYITPSLYHLYSPYGNKNLKPEEALNYEAGLSLLSQKATFTGTLFTRDETSAIDFVSIFDEEGNYVRGEYRNMSAERNVKGVELSVDFQASERVTVSANWTTMDTDKPTTFYRIPKTKYGASVTYRPLTNLTVDVNYNFTGKRTTFDFASFSELTLESFSLVDVYASYEFLNKKLNVFATVNNLFDEEFIAVYGYTTRGRMFNGGVRFKF
ncbi:MAG TPA: TonB-dependent receptor [Chryseosolibacter sp.]